MERFSVDLFLGSVEKDSYIPKFTSGGYVTLAKCLELTEQDLEKIGVPYKFGRSDYKQAVTSGIPYVNMSGLGFIRFSNNKN